MQLAAFVFVLSAISFAPAWAQREEDEVVDAQDLLGEEAEGVDAERTIEPPLDARSEPPGDVRLEGGRVSEEPSLQARLEESFRFGDPVPLTQREPTLPGLGVELNLRYGLVGTGPTRFINDIRFGIFDWLELRTSLAPYPSSLMGRVRLGDRTGPFGALLFDGGLAHWDAGLRLVPDAGETAVGVRLHFEGVVAYTWSFLERFSLYASAHYRYRLSLLPDDDQHAFAVDSMVTYDLLPWLAVSAGLGYAQALGTPVRELAVGFVETDRPGVSHFLLRDDASFEDLDPVLVGTSVTIPLAMTYGRTEGFDVDLFCTPRVFPKLDILFGAGIRWRYDLKRLY